MVRRAVIENMQWKRNSKMKSESGFTLAETLLAVLILLLVSSIVASGVPAARNAYEKVVLASNADVLLSTTISSLRNELSTAGNIELGKRDGDSKYTAVYYYNRALGTKSKIWIDPSEEYEGKETIRYQRYAGSDLVASVQSDSSNLIPRAMATGDLYVTYDSVRYENQMLIFENLQVNRISGATGLAKRTAFSVWLFE